MSGTGEGVTPRSEPVGVLQESKLGEATPKLLDEPITLVQVDLLPSSTHSGIPGVDGRHWSQVRIEQGREGRSTTIGTERPGDKV